MKRLTRWTIALGATAALTAPAAALAQQTPPSTATPTQSSPAQPTPAEPSTTPASPSQPSAEQTDTAAVKRHLTAARDTLSQLTQLPAAAQLSGDARTNVSQLITSFNELITTNSEWRASYAKVTASLNTLIGDQRTDESPATPATGTPGAVGTSGSTAIDPAIRAKLVEFKAHLAEFEKAASGSAPSSTSAPAPSTSPTPAATATTGSAASEERPAGTSGRSVGEERPAASNTSAAEPAAQAHQQHKSAATGSQQEQAGHADAIRHLEAIETILNGAAPSAGSERPTATSGSSAGNLDRDQVAQIRSHLTELRRLLNQSGGQ